MATAAAEAASAKKATDILILEIGSLLGITDYFVICSGASERQVGTIVEEVARGLRALGIRPYRIEGKQENRWVLLDFIDVVVHVFHEETRAFYELERLWKDAPRVPFEDSFVAEEVSG